MDYLPINIGLKNKKCLVLGAGPVAVRKIQMLLKVQATVSCVALECNPEIIHLSEQNKIVLIQQEIADYLSNQELKYFFLIISATGNKFIAKKVFRLCEENNVLVNTVDNKSLCNYISPAIVDRNPLIISISTGGTAPVLARNIREQLEKIIPQKIGLLAQKAGSLRSKVKFKIQNMLDRKKFWERFFASSVSKDIINQKEIGTDEQLIDNIAGNINSEGEVYLVGAGPGDPELLTIKALRVMQKADVILYDRLVSKEVLELVRRDAELINVGKSPRNHHVEQSEINQLLVKHALMGKGVCRLKGGDPFVFGRGAEELQELKKNNIKYQIIPGITAAIGCSAYAGIPLTHRDYAQNVLFITAHCKNSINTLDWKSLGREKQTIVVYMGLMKSDVLTKNLIKHGKKAETPIALIENGTNSNQRVIRGVLGGLSNLIKSHEIISPALIVIGEVVALADELAWFNPQFKNIKHNLARTKVYSKIA